MRSLISNSLVASVRPKAKPFEIRDTRLKGFVLRVQPSGAATYYIEIQRGRRMSIGRADAIMPALARQKAKEVLAEAYQGKDPIAAKKYGRNHTLKSFIEAVYAPWASANIRTADATVQRLKASYKSLLRKPLAELTPWQIEKWRVAESKRGIKPSTVNRALDDLRSSLNKAIAWGLLETNPVAVVKRARVDPIPMVRFLTEDEELRLRTALINREERIKTARNRANLWRAERAYPLLPNLTKREFADRLRPMVLLSINTGLRQGELFNLDWADIDLDRATLTIRGIESKSGRTRHVPLNSEAVETLQHWKEDIDRTIGLVFPGKRGRINNVRRAWLATLKAAGIENFRWHDMRHSFASRLVMAGVDLNTVRELLGHSDYKMTLRYAHLAPEHKAAAVAKLVAR